MHSPAPARPGVDRFTLSPMRQIDAKLQALLTEHGLECAPPLTTARLLDKLVSRRQGEYSAGKRVMFRERPLFARWSETVSAGEDGEESGTRWQKERGPDWVFVMIFCLKNEGEA